MEKPTWKKVKSKIAYENRWLKLREDDVIQPDKQASTYTFLDVNPGNMIIAEDGDGGVFMIKEYRYPIKKAVWLLPMGVIGKNETLLGNAKKELKEETGITAKRWEKIGEFYPYTGKANSIIYVFLATDLDVKNMGINQEGDESIWQLKKFSITEIKNMIKENRIESGEALAALNIYFNQM